MIPSVIISLGELIKIQPVGFETLQLCIYLIALIFLNSVYIYIILHTALTA